MSVYIFFILTILFYVCLIFFPPTAAQNDIVTGFLVFAFYGIGFLSSAALTILLVKRGGLDWVSPSESTRNIIVGIGWISMTVATLLSIDLASSTEPQSLRYLFQLLARSKSVLWLPLLMILPYFFLLNANIRASVPEALYKIPLIAGFAISIFMVLGLVFTGLKKKEPVDKSKISVERNIEKINNSTREQVWDFTSRNMDEKVRKYALEITKQDINWEQNMISQLTGNNRYSGVYAYLDGNSPDHPELFIDPIKNNIGEIAIQISLTIQGKNSRDESFLSHHLNVDRLCRVLNDHFKDSSIVFKPNMLEVQKALDTAPLDRYSDIRDKYRLAVEQWLSSNK